MPNVLLQELDVVNFSAIRYSPATIRSAELRASRLVKLSLVVYDFIHLHPTQALDLALLRKGGALAQLLELGPRAPVRVYCLGDRMSLLDNLAASLRRTGLDANVFSSLPNGNEHAARWSEIWRDIRPDPARVDTPDLLRIAAESIPAYGELIERARELDGLDLPRRRVCDDAPAFAEVLAIARACRVELPMKKAFGTRSEAQRAVAADLGADWASRMAPYDLITNVRDAIRFEAVPLVSWSRVFAEDEILDTGVVQAIAGGYAHVVLLDYEGLLQQQRELLERLDRTSIDRLLDVIAATNARGLAAEGWKRVGEGKLPAASQMFDAALTAVRDVILREDATADPPSDGELTLGLDGVHVPVKDAERAVKALARALKRPIHGAACARRLPREPAEPGLVAKLVRLLGRSDSRTRARDGD